MNQIKYLVYSSLILLGLLIGLLFYSLFPFEKSPGNATTESLEKNVVVTLSSPGKTIFQQNCQSCHSLDKRLSGPALRGITERGPWTDKTNIYKWVQNPAAFIATTPYTKALHKEYGQIMPSFPQLSQKDIDEILDYITEASRPMPVAVR
jgi:mono/diheme cytochrome c family protein